MHYNKDFEVLCEQNIRFKKSSLLKFSLYKNSLFRTIKPFNYTRYNQALKANQWIDFDDILIYFLNISKKNLIFFNHILVDEFQDTNALQFAVLKHLIDPKTHVFAVGDPDQAIYRFRGSCKAIIERFIKTFQAQVYLLKINYRSKRSILQLANRLILSHKTKYSKMLMANETASGHLAYNIYPTEEIEAISIINAIKTYITKGVKAHDIAIIYRNHFRAHTLKYFLNSNDLRYTIDDKREGFLNCLTMHQSKGLEFNVVFIMGIEQQIIPSRRILQVEGKHEERRLLFVAITRAKDSLHLSRVKVGLQGQHLNASCFVKECGLR